MEDSQVAAALSAQLAERIGRKRFELWFPAQAQLRPEGESLVIRAASAFVRDWLRAYFADEIRSCWEAVVGGTGRVEFEIDSSVVATRANANGHAHDAVETSGPAKTAIQSESPAPRTFDSEPAKPETSPATRANPRQVKGLAAFIVGSSNEYAFRAAELTSRGRQQASPLLFFGPTGVGKTHLLRAIQQEYARKFAAPSALYLTAEQFTTCFVEALRGSGMPSFRQKCRSARILAIDDLQFFAGKRRTLEELLYTIDAFLADGRQIVLASDRGLAELRVLGPELVSRLSGGLVCEMNPPEHATRLGIVRQLAAETGVALSDGVAALVAMQITDGARELQGALHRLEAMSKASGEPITRSLAERALAEIARHSTRLVRLADVQKVVCDAFGVEPAQLRSDRKARAIAEPRMLAMWLARKYTRSAWSEIGEYFGRSSHSTVISAHRRVEKLIAEQGQVEMAHQACGVDEAIRRLETALRTA